MPMENSLTHPLPQLEAVFYRRSIPTDVNYFNASSAGNTSSTSPSTTPSNIHNNAHGAGVSIINSSNIVPTSFPAHLLHSNEEMFQYHNHILIGNHLYYILRPLRPNHSDVGKFRLVLVQGTSKGRLRGIKLTQETNIHTHFYNASKASTSHLSQKLANSTHNHEDVDVRATESLSTIKQIRFPTSFLITLNGIDDWGRKQVPNYNTFSIQHYYPVMRLLFLFN